MKANIKGKQVVKITSDTLTSGSAPHTLIQQLQANIDRFLYADTDSLHLTGLEMPGLDKKPTK